MTPTHSPPALKPNHVIDGLRAIRNRHNLLSIGPDIGPKAGRYFDLSDDLEQEACLSWVSYQQDIGRNVYFHANPVRNPDMFPGFKANKSDILFGSHAQMDLDPDPDNSLPFAQRRETVEKQLEWMMKKNPPSVVIDSGNGFNVLWALKEPMSCDDYDVANKAFNEFYGVKGTFNVDRILKVPGTIAYPNRVKLQKGYPAQSQATLWATNKEVITDFEELPSKQGTTGTTTTVTKGTRIPISTGITQFEKDRLRDIIKKTPELLNSLEPGAYPDQSRGLAAVAGACVRAALDRLDFANVVSLADKSDAHQHLINQTDQEYALGRAWDEVVGQPAKDQFSAVAGANAVPPPPPKVTPEQWENVDLGLENQEVLAAYNPPALRTYVENFNMEGVRIFGGQSKSGKSFLTMQEAQAIAQGDPEFLGMTVKRGKVLYCGFEDGKTRMHRRIMDLNFTPCRDIQYWHEAELSAAENLAKMVAIHAQFPFDVMYIDTMKWWQGRSEARNGNAYDQSVEDMLPVTKFAKEKGVSLTMTTHLRKDKRGVDDWMDTFQGSVGIVATATAIVALEKKRGSNEAVLHRSSRDGSDESDIAVQWDDTPNGWILSPYSAASVNAKTHARKGSAKEKIIEYLQQRQLNGPPIAPKADIILSIGVAKTNFYKAVRDLKREQVVEDDQDDVWLA